MRALSRLVNARENPSRFVPRVLFRLGIIVYPECLFAHLPISSSPNLDQSRSLVARYQFAPEFRDCSNRAVMIGHARGRLHSGRHQQPILVELQQQLPCLSVTGDKVQHRLPGIAHQGLVAKCPSQQFEALPRFPQARSASRGSFSL